jgi:acyl-CoA thioester hydrolase
MTCMPRHRAFTSLRWSDMDAYGHVNNVQYLRLLEDARVLAFGVQGSHAGGTLVATGLIVARTEIEYLEPLVFRAEPVQIDMWVTGVRGADFDLGYEVRDPDPDPDPGSGSGNGAGAGAGDEPAGDPKVYARAETTQVVYDLATARPRRLTPDERARLDSLRDEPVAWRRRRGSRR